MLNSNVKVTIKMNAEVRKQHDAMRGFFDSFMGDQKAVCAAYVRAERAGYIRRTKNEDSMTSVDYANALWNNGKSTGWLA